MAWAIQTVYELLEEVGADINFDPAAPMKTPEDVSKRWKDLEKQRKCFAALLSILRDPRESPRPPMRTPDEHRVVCLLCLIRTVALRLFDFPYLMLEASLAAISQSYRRDVLTAEKAIPRDVQNLLEKYTVDMLDALRTLSALIEDARQSARGINTVLAFGEANPAQLETRLRRLLHRVEEIVVGALTQVLMESKRPHGVAKPPFDFVSLDESRMLFDDLNAIASEIDAVALRPASAGTEHSDDFTSVLWFGIPYEFGAGQQAACVGHLWRQWERRTPNLSEATIGELVGSSNASFRLAHVFRDHPAFGTMIRQSGKGVYRPNPPESRENPD